MLATVCVRLKIGNTYTRPIRAICDPGSQLNIMSIKTADEFKLSRNASNAGLRAFNGVATRAKGEASLQLWHNYKDESICSAKFVIVPDDLPDHPLVTFRPEPFPRLRLYEFADQQYFKHGKIDLLLGVGLTSKHTKEGVAHNSVGLLAQNTSFGWIMSGGNEECGTNQAAELPTVGVVIKDELRNMIQKLWEVDEMEERKLSADDEYCEQHYHSTVVLENKRYSVLIPLKPNAELGNSRNKALQRFYALENRFNRDPEFKAKYVKFMDDYCSLDHMRPASPLDLEQLHCYLLHHGVAFDRKPRVVFSGKDQTTNGSSLNDIQFTGPRLQKDLLDIVINFRIGKCAMSADVCKMFRQIRLQQSQWNLQRILWRTEPNQPIRDYWLTVVTYGLRSSPYLAVKTLRQCALDNAKEYPTAAAVVLNDFYVDDLLTSTDTVAQAVMLKEELINLLDKGSFELAKWRSNIAQLFEDEEPCKIVEASENTSVLGLKWDYKEDEFCFEFVPRTQPDVITKRYITSEAAKHYDPQGWIAPKTMQAKLFIQEAWRAGSDWDRPLDPQLQQEWKVFYEDLKLIDQLRIPRWLKTTASSEVQIHMFADASAKAYGVAVYVRTKCDGKWKAQLLCSRSKVAPLKTLTIPRLELSAVELSCKLINKLRGINRFKTAPLYLWTDSEIVLNWTRKDSNLLTPFVGNRIANIFKVATPGQIRHIRSEENPADVLSRGSTIKELLTNRLWWNGPAMLRQNEDDWPEWSNKKCTSEEQAQIEAECKKPPKLKPTVLMATRHDDIEYEPVEKLIEKISSVDKLCRVTAYVLRFCLLCLGPLRKRKQAKDNFIASAKEKRELSLINEFGKGNKIDVNVDGGKQIQIAQLSIHEMNNALDFWIIASQKQAFPVEYEALAKKKEIPKYSRLRMLTPWIDELGLLRITGRLANSELPLSQKKPIILDYKGELAKRLAVKAHKELMHGGVQMCTPYLRQKYWILQCRKLLRSTVHACMRCCRYREKHRTQLMADIPAYRLNPAPAFYHCGVDYAGPFDIKYGRNTTVKAYICVFVCMVTKAVHLELVSSLHSDSFLKALHRFINLRAGAVRHMYSDNGRNFVGADRALHEAAQEWLDAPVMAFLQNRSVEWHYNPPYAPHHGGLWEAAVKSTKHHLKRVCQKQLYTYEDMATLLTKISACLNSRPLTPMSTDPTDLTTLTPGHFLTGQPILAPYEPLLADVPLNRLSSWQKLQKIQQEFWERWSQEYISEQQCRNKWTDPTLSIKVNDMVFVKQEQTPACEWLMGRVMEVFPSQTDELVRTRRLRTKKGEMVRAITQLCVLPMDDEQMPTFGTGLS